MKVIFPIILISCTLSVFNGFGQSYLYGHIKGLNNDTISVNVNTLDVRRSYDDTIVASNGNFIYRKMVTEPTMVMLKPESAFEENPIIGSLYLPLSKRIFILLTAHDTIKVNAELSDSNITYDIISSIPFNQEFCDRHNSNLHNKTFRLEIERKMSASRIKNDRVEMERLENEYLALRTKDHLETYKYIETNPNKDISACLVIGSTTPIDFMKYYEILTPKVKNGLFKNMLYERSLLAKNNLSINRSTNAMVNSKAPEFTSTSLDGRKISLSNFNGKIVVLDFWGTWCIPCIQGLPNMKTYYQKVSKKIEFIGIACNENIKRVSELINTQDLKWTQLMNKSPVDIALKFEVSSYPTKIIINDKGIILNVFVGESEDFYKKIDELFNDK
jgi:thiol-disulfide isomerase/thioredoxin